MPVPSLHLLNIHGFFFHLSIRQRNELHARAASLVATHRGKIKNILFSTLRDNQLTQDPKSCILSFEKEAQAYDAANKNETQGKWSEEVRHDVGLTQYHMILKCSLEQFWSVALLVTGAQPAMAMKSAPFCLTCVVGDNVFAKAEIAIIWWIGTCPLSYGSIVVMEMMNIFFSGSERWMAGVWRHTLYILCFFATS